MCDHHQPLRWPFQVRAIGPMFVGLSLQSSLLSVSMDKLSLSWLSTSYHRYLREDNSWVFCAIALTSDGTAGYFRPDNEAPLAMNICSPRS